VAINARVSICFELHAEERGYIEQSAEAMPDGCRQQFEVHNRDVGSDVVWTTRRNVNKFGLAGRNM